MATSELLQKGSNKTLLSRHIANNWHWILQGRQTFLIYLLLLGHENVPAVIKKLNVLFNKNIKKSWEGLANKSQSMGAATLWRNLINHSSKNRSCNRWAFAIHAVIHGWLQGAERRKGVKWCQMHYKLVVLVIFMQWHPNDLGIIKACSRYLHVLNRGQERNFMEIFSEFLPWHWQLKEAQEY